MPTIAYFEGIRIVIHINEHNPPHFHVVYAEHDGALAIADLTLTKGSLPRGVLNKVLEWASGRELELLDRWNEITQTPR